MIGLVGSYMQEKPKKRKADTGYNRKPVKKCDVERLAAIGRHSSEVAHELNNQLDGIMRYVNLTLRLVERENLDKPKEYLSHCQKSLTRMAYILRELLEFSRGTRIRSEYIKIEQLIEDAIKTTERRAVSSNVRISRNYSSGLPAVRSGNLIQVFINLARNALDAMPDGGELIISTRKAKNDTIAVEFRDTGKGLPPGDPEAIFEPFSTTKEKGTGLGLAISRDIIESNRGRITAENAPEGGSLFTVYVPVSSQAWGSRT
jgi:signal transduction histidine kinase